MEEEASIEYLTPWCDTCVQTEYEGQAKKYMDVVQRPDAIVAVGGNGTVSEVSSLCYRRICVCVNTDKIDEAQKQAIVCSSVRLCVCKISEKLLARN